MTRRDPTLVATTNKGVLVTLKRDGRPQLSNIIYAYDALTRTAGTSGRTKSSMAPQRCQR